MLLSTRILRELKGIPCKRCVSTEGAAHANGQVLMIAGDRIAVVEAVTDAKRFAEFEVKVLGRGSPRRPAAKSRLDRRSGRA